MKDYTLHWTAEELKVYILLFFINNNPKNEDSGLDQLYINNQEFNKIREEFNSDNDYQSIQKICKVAKTENYSNTELYSLLFEVKKWLNWAEKKYNCQLSSNRFTTLERILVKAA